MMEYIIIAVIVLWFVFSMRSMIKKGAGCCGDCEKCGQDCKKKRCGE